MTKLEVFNYFYLLPAIAGPVILIISLYVASIVDGKSFQQSINYLEGVTQSFNPPIGFYSFVAMCSLSPVLNIAFFVCMLYMAPGLVKDLVEHFKDEY